MGLVYFALYHVTVAIASKVMHVAVTDSFFVINAVIAALPAISNTVACFSYVVRIEWEMASPSATAAAS